MNFLEQMQSSNDPMITMIKNHLLSRSDTSELLKKENKNIEDMMLFVGHELYVKYLKGKNNHRMACVAGPPKCDSERVKMPAWAFCSQRLLSILAV